MQQSKGCKRHYFSVESILASEEQISCSFLRDQYDIGKLENAQPVAGQNWYPVIRIILFSDFFFSLHFNVSS